MQNAKSIRQTHLDRRAFLASCAAWTLPAADSPLIDMPKGYLRKPAGDGRFPAVIVIHGGLQELPIPRLKELALSTTPSRFVAAGYVTAIITYGSRDHDPQSPVSLEDCMSALQFVRMLPYVDSRSIAVYGCSGGGDLALEMAAAADLGAMIAEEPASVMFTGVFNSQSPKQGDRFTPADAGVICDNPKQYYTKALEKKTDRKIGRMKCPLLILQGDQNPINQFNAAILIPQLTAWGKTMEVKTYPGQPHCFGFQGRAGSDKLFQDIDAFCRKYLPVRPRP